MTTPKKSRKPRPVMDRARLALSRAVLAPMLRYQALARELRTRDLTEDEVVMLSRAAEQARDAAHALRKGASHER